MNREDRSKSLAVAAALLLALVVTLGAYALAEWANSGTPDAGTITRREYEPARLVGKVWQHERWSVRILNGDREGWATATEAQYAACHIGDAWPDCGQR